MPGIVGFVSKEQDSIAQSTLDLMVSSLMHEPHYNSNTLVQEELGLHVGWVNHRNSYSDCLPIWNENRDRCLIFSGEHYSDSKYDTAQELILLYERLEDNFYEKLNGVFCGVIIDKRKGKAVLFNDRFGLKRLHYHTNQKGTYFASEAKALLKAVPELRQFDAKSLGEFFSCGCTLQNRTLFEGIHIMPGASAWEFSPRAEIRKRRYFDISTWEGQSELPPRDYYAQMDETFTRVLPSYFKGQEKVSLSLTGGLDSRMIVAGMDLSPGSLHCHTFGGMIRECADLKLAKRIARTCQQTHDTISIDETFFPEFPKLAEQSVYRSDGTMDVTGSVELFANRFVSQNFGVRITGNYGSEILRSNVTFGNHQLYRNLISKDFLQHIDLAEKTYQQEREGSGTSFIAFKQVPWFHYARFSVEQSLITTRSPFLDNEVVATAFRAPSDPAENRIAAHRYIMEHNAKLARIPTDRGIIGTNKTSHGPLSQFVQEFMPRVEYVFDYGMPQWLARLDPIMKPFRIEKLFLGRQKFYHFRSWYRDHFSEYIKEVLLDPSTLNLPYLDAKRIEELVDSQLKGRHNYTLQIHKLLTCEIIQRRLIARA